MKKSTLGFNFKEWPQVYKVIFCGVAFLFWAILAKPEGCLPEISLKRLYSSYERVELLNEKFLLSNLDYTEEINRAYHETRNYLERGIDDIKRREKNTKTISNCTFWRKYGQKSSKFESFLASSGFKYLRRD